MTRIELATRDDIEEGGGGGGGGGGAIAEINVEDYGAKCDCRKTSGASIAASSNQLTCSAAAFTDDDVGKYVLVQRAGSVVVPPPTGLAATPVGAAGVFAAGTYYYRVDAGVCESGLAAAQIGPITVSLNDAVDLTWDAVTNLHLRNGFYSIYRSAVSGAWTGSKLVGVVRAVGYDGLPLTTLRDTGRTLYPLAPATSDLSPDDLVAKIASVAGGVATLDRNATRTVAGVTMWWGTPNARPMEEAAAAAVESFGHKKLVIPGPPARYDGTYPNGIYEELAYLMEDAAWMPNFSGLAIEGRYRPRLRNIARDTEAMVWGAVLGSKITDVVFSSVNRWAGSDAGFVLDQAEYRHIGTLAAPVSSTSAGIVATFDDPLPDWLFLNPNREAAGFLSWNYDAMASPTVAPGYEGVWYKRDPSDPTNKRKILLTFRGKHGTTPTTHLAGANFVFRPGQWDCNDNDIDIGIESEIYQPSRGSLCRINRALATRLKVTAGGVGGGWPACGSSPIFKGGTHDGYVVVGNNTRRYKYGQANSYVNIIKIKDSQFRRGGNSFILIESPDCETLLIDQPLFEALTFSHPGAVLGGPTNQLYGPEINNAWDGDSGGSGGSILWNLNTLRLGTLRNPNFFTPSGGDDNSGYAAYLRGDWLVIGGWMTGGSATYAGVFYAPTVDAVVLTVLGTQFINAVPLTAPQVLNAANLTLLGASSSPYQANRQLTGPVALLSEPVKTVTAGYVVLGNDMGKTIFVDAATPQTISLQGGYEGSSLRVVQKGAGQVTIAGYLGTVVWGPDGLKTSAQGAVLEMLLSGGEWHVWGQATT